MKQNQIVQETIYKHQPNELIFANKVYSQQLVGKVSEAAYYKTLERMCKAGTLAKAAKGTYYIPKQSAFGVVPPSEREIVSSFTKNHSGTVIGYTLYNQLGLTTQIAKTVEVLSSAMEAQVKTIRNVVVLEKERGNDSCPGSHEKHQRDSGHKLFRIGIFLSESCRTIRPSCF